MCVLALQTEQNQHPCRYRRTSITINWSRKVSVRSARSITDPITSLRTSFREVILEGVFRQSLHEINRTDQDQPWLSDRQIDDLIEDLLNGPARSLLEAKEATLEPLYGTQLEVNEVTGEQYPNVKLIDFDHPERDHFLAINQFRVDTPGATKGFIIPDIVLFVNGLPLVDRVDQPRAQLLHS
jgi:type I restriction enzyme, R subunit